MVEPLAEKIDREQHFPGQLVTALGEQGWLGAALPARWGGGGLDPVDFGPVLEEFGWGCASARTLLTVHNMAAQAVLRYGNEEQKRRHLPGLASGRSIIAFALTEPDVGSDANAIGTSAVEDAGGYVLSGEKIWCSFGCIANLFLVFASCNGKPLALILERDSPGLKIERMTDVFGTRGSELARLHLDAVRVPAENRIGAPNAGIRFVANTALDHGRFSVACGTVGIIRACLDTCTAYAARRQQGGVPISQHQLVRRILTDGLVAYTTARALCDRAARLRAAGDPRAAAETALAKYHSAEAAIRVANDAVALLGANGCSSEFPVSRYLRDATVSGIIEGTREIHQISLASYALQKPWTNA
jgi:alkylation response protein AidB-like acyl-CoA dehydrogenase